MIDKMKVFAPAVALSIALAFSASPVFAGSTQVGQSEQSVQLAQAATDAPQKKKGHKKGHKKGKKKDQTQ
ncbi:MAG: hypothetical protein U1F33_13790 [Alphaproteobacteria bacterium]